jgi:multisubunit Na+/H+ antiporter MnhC subunit
MPDLLPLLHATAHTLRARLSRLRRDRGDQRDAGYTTETLVVTALVVTIAVTALGILSAKVIAKANGISLG